MDLDRIYKCDGCGESVRNWSDDPNPDRVLCVICAANKYRREKKKEAKGE